MAVHNITLNLSANTKQFDAAIKRMQRQLAQMGSSGGGLSFGKLFGSITSGNIAAQAFHKTLSMLTGGFLEAVRGGMELEDQTNSLQATFGSTTPYIQSVIDRLAHLGAGSTAELQSLASMLGEFAKDAGLASGAASVMTADMIRLAGDIKSRFGVPLQEVAQSMISSLRGTGDMGRFGIVFNESDIEKRARQLQGKGMKDMFHNDELTHYGKAKATQSIIMERAGRTSGDLETHQGQAKNSLAALMAHWTDGMAKLGQGFNTLFLGPILNALKVLVDSVGSVFSTSIAKESLAELTGLGEQYGKVLKSLAPLLAQHVLKIVQMVGITGRFIKLTGVFDKMATVVQGLAWTVIQAAKAIQYAMDYLTFASEYDIKVHQKELDDLLKPIEEVKPPDELKAPEEENGSTRHDPAKPNVSFVGLADFSKDILKAFHENNAADASLKKMDEITDATRDVEKAIKDLKFPEPLLA